MKFVLGTAHVHSGTSQRHNYLFLFQYVVAYATTLPNLQPDVETPILLCRDFNVDVTQNEALREITNYNFNFDCVTMLWPVIVAM
jgi:hypothetical protein